MLSVRYLLGGVRAVSRRITLPAQADDRSAVGAQRLVGPLAANMAKTADEEHAYLYVLRVAMASFIKGTAPIMAVEVARRAIPGHVRPTFQELETYCRNRGDAAAPKEAAA